MRFIGILFFLLLIIKIPANAQSPSDTIEMRKSFWHGSGAYINGKKISGTEVAALLVLNPESKTEFMKARKSYLWGCIVWAAGAGVAIAAIANKDKKSFGPTIIAGAAISTCSLPFLVKTRKHISRSISAYNRNLANAH